MPTPAQDRTAHEPHTNGPTGPHAARPARYLSDLSPKMSAALIRCHVEVVLIATCEERGIAAATVRALQGRGLLTEGRDRRSRRTWKPTEAGRALIATEEPRFLAAQSQKGYTTVAALALPNEPEAVDDATLTRYSAVNRERHEAIKAGADQELFAQQRTLERRLWELKRVALERGVNVRSELRLIERGLDALEAKIRNQRAA